MWPNLNFDVFPLTACSLLFYFSCTTSVYQQLHVLFILTVTCQTYQFIDAFNVLYYSNAITVASSPANVTEKHKP